MTAAHAASVPAPLTRCQPIRVQLVGLERAIPKALGKGLPCRSLHGVVGTLRRWTRVGSDKQARRKLWQRTHPLETAACHHGAVRTCAVRPARTASMLMPCRAFRR